MTDTIADHEHHAEAAAQRAPVQAPFPTTPLRFLCHYIAGHPWLHGAVFAAVLGAVACSISSQYAIKMLVDAMSLAERNEVAVWTALTVFAVLIGAENGLWRISGWMGCRAIIAVGVDIRLDLFRHLTGHAQRYFVEHLAGAVANRITATAGAAGAILGTLIWNIVPPCADFIGAAIVLTTIDWWMAVALGVFVVALAGGLAWAGVHGRSVHRAYADEASVLNGELVDTVSNVWIVRAFSARAREATRIAQRLGIEAIAQRRSWMYLEKMRVAHDLCLWLMSGAMLVWAVHLWNIGRITPGDVVIVSSLTFRILHGSRDLALALVGWTQHLARIADSAEVIGAPHHVADTPDARPLINLGGAIDFEDVSFAYPDGRKVFERFTLRVPAGQRVGIVGPSGAGKSTLVSLVQRLDDVQRGRILIDGQSVASVTQDTLRAAIAVVPQEISLFHRSIHENIRYGRPGASDEDVVAAAKAARCDDFIRALPDGYDTLVGERGVKLSGGQRQRIGIARAFLKDAPIIVLDEATSALDTESEIEIQRALSALMRGRTVLAVAHRLSTVASFDRIVVIDDGQILEDGPPDELRRRHGVFAAMWRMQTEEASPG
jgi:ATP-binding cassette subfamily B protein